MSMTDNNVGRGGAGQGGTDVCDHCSRSGFRTCIHMSMTNIKGQPEEDAALARKLQEEEDARSATASAPPSS